MICFAQAFLKRMAVSGVLGLVEHLCSSSIPLLDFFRSEKLLICPRKLESIFYIPAVTMLLAD